jgi:predicted RND superfamily exporter protein
VEFAQRFPLGPLVAFTAVAVGLVALLVLRLRGPKGPGNSARVEDEQPNLLPSANDATAEWLRRIVIAVLVVLALLFVVGIFGMNFSSR